jgi:hypothetical protein
MNFRSRAVEPTSSRARRLFEGVVEDRMIGLAERRFA